KKKRTPTLYWAESWPAFSPISFSTARCSAASTLITAATAPAKSKVLSIIKGTRRFVDCCCCAVRLDQRTHRWRRTPGRAAAGRGRRRPRRSREGTSPRRAAPPPPARGSCARCSPPRRAPSSSPSSRPRLQHQSPPPLQVIFRATHWLRFWAQLQRCEMMGSS
ncbi:Os03g0344232, partial [Oryza sativa Japonica Group]